MKRYKYHWLFVPSGETGEREQEFASRLDFLAALDDWNSKSPGFWHYWSAP